MIEQASLVIGEGNWAVKSDSLLGYKINNGKYYPREMSVVRATTGTRINEDGLVEVVPYNLIEYSEQFNVSPWSVGTATTITPNTTTAPNGTLTADTITCNGTGFFYVRQNIFNGSTEQCAVSVYAKKGNHSFFGIRNESVGSVADVFNFDTKTWTQNTSSTLSYEELADGWFRLTAVNSSASGLYYFWCAPVIDATGNISGTASNLTAYIWGGQAEFGSSALDYLPTTDRLDVARIDYSSGSAALLVEPQRTNLNLYSEDLSNAWYNKYNSSISTNVITAPSGISNADKIIENTNNSFHYVETVNSLSFGQSYTISAYLKKAERDFGYIGVYTFESKQIRVNLTNGTIDNTTGTWINTKIEDAGNGWYRVSGTFDAYSTSYFFAGSALNATTVSYTGNGTSGIYLWGAQLELGSYATSYIPTQGSTVTRNADVISKTGIADLIGQTEGTLFVDAYITGKDSSNGSILLATDKVSSGAIIRILYTQTNALRFDVFDGSSFQCQISAGAFNVGDRLKIAGAYKNNDFAMYVNGTQIGTDTSGSVPATDTANINTSIYGDTNGSFIQAAALFKTRLTNAELATLTTI